MGPNDNFTTSRWRRNRSNANLLEQNLQPMPSAANMNSLRPPPALERKNSSRMSLFNLFSKPKVEKARGHIEVGLAVPMQPQEPPRPASPPKSALRPNPPPQAQQVHRMRSSQFLRPKSMRPPSIARHPGDDWEPPPLFQAYPQAIKYATIQACVYSPDALMRTQSQRRQAEMMRERMDSHRDLSTTLETPSEHKKLEKTHKRLDSILHSTPQLTNKIYVLVTSGHILQYSGEGPFDRLPERVLRLGKDSAAFASDLIPGKHWVLQILHSANEDGTAGDGPKHSLLHRLRIGAPARRDASSFLLVMESAEEMESWMTIVRKEIENLGGKKASSESSRNSASIDESPENTSIERPYQRPPVKRGSSRLSTITPVDSPLQSQYSDSPRIVTSEWESGRKEKAASVVDSASIQSSRPSLQRQSVEASSIPTSRDSHEQIQLDQLRERSRYSYVSSATSVSGVNTRNTSRDPSPAPPSPIKEVSTPADAEPRRSETSLRSFHMHPGNNSTRRRSMQPLPVTNEDITASAQIARTPKRHSIYGPTSPTTSEPRRKLEVGTPLSDPIILNSSLRAWSPANNVQPRASAQSQNALPAPYMLRSSSAPPGNMLSALSPPPQQPLPTPPSQRPQSTSLGNMSNAAAALPYPGERRISATPKPYLRPLPVRPQSQNSDGSVVVPRRSSLASGNKPARLPLGVVVNRSVTEPARPSTTASPITQRQSSPSRPYQPAQPQPAGQSLRRPTSVQIRSDPAPFLSSSRPNRVVSSAPSFVPGNRSISSTPPSIPVLRGHGQQLAPPKNLAPRRSMPAMGLPPPAPPPNMPLPPPPPTTTVGGARAVAV
ncbi:uncharacterized protein CC84DRAFT_1092558 [Paraphaeosphaeria sporulosa]|uniref:PH domain-containing protein n=1 Tax=Paraphaeosphaeria sporulosa TaxID=1460663 RepID=A0A177CH32_9PLEO|nr:uncharacterized protein CC84DRAFT_1092558 [Paraphaeosphaeria sporulosa]OAG06168.1 hypothetical protein CC84DRAFT_1092558 [Paraphaeosphaeria sporulosa]